MPDKRPDVEAVQDWALAWQYIGPEPLHPEAQHEVDMRRGVVLVCSHVLLLEGLLREVRPMVEVFGYAGQLARIDAALAKEG